jgi:hypothetical protein
MIPDFISKQRKTRLELLGWYQIVGGIAGVLVTLWILSKTEQITWVIALLFLLAFALYSFSIYCGKLLLGAQYSRGLSLSILNQVPQIVSFAFIGYAYQYNAGAAVELALSYGSGTVSSGLNFGVDFGMMPKWLFSIASDDLSFKLSVNLLAIYLIYFIDKLREALLHEKVNHEIAGIEPEI